MRAAGYGGRAVVSRRAAARSAISAAAARRLAAAVNAYAAAAAARSGWATADAAARAARPAADRWSARAWGAARPAAEGRRRATWVRRRPRASAAVATAKVKRKRIMGRSGGWKTERDSSGRGTDSTAANGVERRERDESVSHERYCKRGGEARVERTCRRRPFLNPFRVCVCALYGGERVYASVRSIQSRRPSRRALGTLGFRVSTMPTIAQSTTALNPTLFKANCGTTQRKYKQPSINSSHQAAPT